MKLKKGKKYKSTRVLCEIGASTLKVSCSDGGVKQKDNGALWTFRPVTSWCRQVSCAGRHSAHALALRKVRGHHQAGAGPAGASLQRLACIQASIPATFTSV